jgi:hypothetical protein
MEAKNPQKIPKNYLCIKCNYSSSNKKDYNRHLLTAKHNLEANGSKKSPNFACFFCDYISSNKKDYNKHLLTRKHIMEANGSKKSPNFACKYCNKHYKSRGSYWKHQQTCSIMLSTADSTTYLENNDCSKDHIIDILKQNQDFKRLMLEQSTQIQLQQYETTQLYKQNEELHKQMIKAVESSGNTIQNQTINNNHQKFNLNFFLNTTCKDAMNMSDFIENINIEFKDIENIGKLGYISGMTEMILSRIQDLDITKRPLHCTDLKRETMYIKDNDEWSKDTSENAKLRDMVSIVAKQNYNTVPLWRKEHPECNVSDHPSYNLCIDMMRNIIGDVGSEQARLDSKVIKNISKSLFVK